MSPESEEERAAHLVAVSEDGNVYSFLDMDGSFFRTVVFEKANQIVREWQTKDRRDCEKTHAEAVDRIKRGMGHPASVILKSKAI